LPSCLPIETTHIEHVFRKLGVRTRAQAVAVAFREGLVELPP
jgi:DNA-binding CsgD family transcriptional regulator